MKVKELLEQLKKFDQEKEVKIYLPYEDEFVNISDVSNEDIDYTGIIKTKFVILRG